MEMQLKREFPKLETFIVMGNAGGDLGSGDPCLSSVGLSLDEARGCVWLRFKQILVVNLELDLAFASSWGWIWLVMEAGFLSSSATHGAGGGSA